MTGPQSLSPATTTYLAGLRQAIDLQSVQISGGPNAVSSTIETLLKNM